jgi:putative tryptophan/tyrosine transport system substrate-binding protein
MIKRRGFITLLGGAAAAWPIAVCAQQPALPVIGFLGPTSLEVFADRLRGFHRGLKETGYSEGENLTVVYRWAEGEFDRLPALAGELVRRRVAVIATGATSAAFAAKAATTTIPVLFVIPEDPAAGGKFRPSGRQSDRGQSVDDRSGGQAAGVPARADPRGCPRCRADQSR